MNHCLPARVWAAMPALIATLIITAPVAQAQDVGKKACMADAKRLCAAEVHALNRKGAEACLFRNIDQTTQPCHDTILMIHVQREQQKSRKT